jgi:hypothetical protein
MGRALASFLQADFPANALTKGCAALQQRPVSGISNHGSRDELLAQPLITDP